MPLRMVCPTIVDRDVELATLEALLGEASARGGRVVLISGEAGIGKSRLLEEFLARSRASGARALIGCCVEAEARRPFGPFIDALRVARGGADVHPTQSDVALTDPDGRYRALRSFAIMLGDLAKPAPLVLAIDDLQWADEGTLELFAYLSRTLREKHVLLLGAYRADEIHRLHPLRAVLAALGRVRTVDTLTLRPLSLAGTSELVRATLGLPRSAPRDLVDALAQRCEGNPFFLEEMLKALAETGQLEQGDGSWRKSGRIADLGVPATVQAVVQSRLGALPIAARDALRIAAVIGTSFDVVLLQALTLTTDEEITGALRAAVEQQFVDEVAGASDRFRFRHALIREAVLADLLGRERRDLHRRIAAELALRAGPADQAEQLAYHFDEAGELAAAHRYHVLAADNATTIFAFGQAKRHLERALELAPEAVDLASLHLRLARTALSAGDPVGALRASEEARRLYESQANARGVGVALGDMSDASWTLGQEEGARRAADEGIRVLEPLGATSELADAYRRMALLEVYDDASRYDWAERAIEIARACGDRQAEAAGLFVLAAAFGWRRRSEGIVHGEHALRLALELDLPDLAFRTRLYLIDAIAKAGGSAAQRREMYEALIAHARGHAFVSDQLLSMELEEAIALGSFDEATRIADQITPETVYGADAELRIALVHVARDGLDGLPHLESIRTRLLDAAVVWQAFATTTAQILLLGGRLREALEHAQPAKAHLAAGSQRFGVDVAVICAIDAARRLGDEAALDDWIGVAVRDEPPVGSLVRQARRAFGRSARAARHADLAAAIAFSGECVAALDHSQWPYVETIARLRHAELLLERGGDADRVAAANELAAVLRFWRKAGARWYLGRLRSWAREHGVRLPAAPAAAARSAQLLTRRQREVATLLSTGLTNREIADQLVISERTVESHVEGIMAKLAVHNRVEIASWMAAARPT